MDLARTFLEHYDPARRGFTPEGMANGLAATGGVYFCRAEGGYLLKRGTSRDAIDLVVGAAGPRATRIAEWSGVSRQPGQAYWYRVVPVGPTGVEAVVPAGGEHIVQVRAGDDGQAEQPAPAAPRELSARPLVGGRVQVVWWPGQEARRPAAAAYCVFAGLGGAEVDWSDPVAIVPAGGTRGHGWQSPAYPHGTVVRLGVRARSAAGTLELNELQVEAVADAEGPAAAAVASSVLGVDE